GAAGRGGYYEVALADAAEAFAMPAQFGLSAPGGLLGGALPGYRIYEAAPAGGAGVEAAGGAEVGAGESVGGAERGADAAGTAPTWPSPPWSRTSWPGRCSCWVWTAPRSSSRPYSRPRQPPSGRPGVSSRTCPSQRSAGLAGCGTDVLPRRPDPASCPDVLNSNREGRTSSKRSATGPGGRGC